MSTEEVGNQRTFNRNDILQVRDDFDCIIVDCVYKLGNNKKGEKVISVSRNGLLNSCVRFFY